MLNEKHIEAAARAMFEDSIDEVTFDEMKADDTSYYSWIIDQANIAIQAYSKALLAETPERAELVVEIQKIEMVDYSTGFEQPEEPVWRIELNGYCADFPSEQAAENFRVAIIANLLSIPANNGPYGWLIVDPALNEAAWLIQDEGLDKNQRRDGLSAFPVYLTNEDQKRLAALTSGGDHE